MQLLKKAVGIGIAVLLALEGLFSLILLWAKGGWPMSTNLRQSILGYVEGVGGFQQILLAIVFIALPLAWLVLWWRGRLQDNLIRVAEGTYVQESAITHFLKTAIEPLSEVQSIRASGKMVSGKGLHLTCHIGVVTSRPLTETKDRLERAVRAVMRERLGIVPVAAVDIRIRDMRADKQTASIAQRAAAAAPAAPPEQRAEGTSVPPTPPPAPEREERASIDLSPAGREVLGESEGIEDAEPKPPPSEGKQ